MDMNFKDQVAVVTGGYSGIGQSSVRRDPFATVTAVTISWGLRVQPLSR
ncbi:MAG TPA: hypothetical protein PK149_11375 [Flavobacteriales bacterium]|nr:hypothetical protein [Flavobacteriales bacterium]